MAGWQAYPTGPAFLHALGGGRAARAVWTALPGEDWPTRIAEAVIATLGGRGLVVVTAEQATALPGFKAKVDLSENHQSFSDLELILGKAKFSGRIDSSQPDDARPSVLMRLEGGDLDVDGLAAFASIFVSDKGANRFANSDLDFQIKAGPVSAAGLTADTVDTAELFGSWDEDWSSAIVAYARLPRS